ncbi:anthranilate synthase component II [Roseivirga misakiensis]|uniref:Aminodeoxychorismate/anthranilate synthase component II n=1 Tax=Roseivirga misakiensis TaxID=1563681 RepID=A0A1E5T190_9BACT|nr:aminodeoxychorismate/anthranilate synthase component II [Roseivirga misakiensis]OEK05126.1 aminodeoxychorismate/anthranilate synthase component II [Roseivirga misakiensis]
MKILVLDNYDSFTYNLVHYLKELGYGDRMEIFRNDQITLDEVAAYDKILLSPGPGIPEEAGVMLDLIRRYGPEKSILGVCLGHQGIAEIYGAKLFNMGEVLHGVSSKVHVSNPSERLFKDIPASYEICHYHSWNVDKNQLGSEIEVTAVDEQGEIMAISHKEYDVKGVQFHPESIMTEYGHKLLSNWLEDS